MPTTVTFYLAPTNMDYLLSDIRLNFGDLTGATFSDSIIRTALVNAVKYLQRRWFSKYQIFTPDLLIDPQPEDPSIAYVNTSDGVGYIPGGLNEGDVFRNPYVVFKQAPPPVIESIDEMGLILAATYILRKTQIASSIDSLVSWSTEDIRYSNLGAERGLAKILLSDKAALDDYFEKHIAKPQVSQFPTVYLTTSPIPYTYTGITVKL